MSRHVAPRIAPLRAVSEDSELRGLRRDAFPPGQLRHEVGQVLPRQGGHVNRLPVEGLRRPDRAACRVRVVGLAAVGRVVDHLCQPDLQLAGRLVLTAPERFRNLCPSGLRRPSIG